MATSQATVFGGSGFIGRYVVKRLAEAGWRILVAVRRPDLAGFLRPLGDVGQIVPIRANILDSDSIAAAVEGSDAVVNLVGILRESGRQRFASIHAQGAERVAKAARAAGSGRLVHVSAIGADAVSPSAYGRSKAAGEAAVRAAVPDAVIVRPSFVFGPEDQFLNRIAALARVAPVLPLVDGGRSRFQPIYVGDVAEAMRAILETPDSAGRLYELGGPRVYTLRELMTYILAETGRKRLLVPVPRRLLSAEAWFLEWLPRPPLTRDQVVMLARDNVVSDAPDVGRLADLGLSPTPLEAVAPEILRRFRPGGGVRPSRSG